VRRTTRRQRQFLILSLVRAVVFVIALVGFAVTLSTVFRSVAQPKNKAKMKAKAKIDRHGVVGNNGDDDCSCYNHDSNTSCCVRTVRRSHKMGYVLTQQLLRRSKLLKQVAVTQKFRIDDETAASEGGGRGVADFRDVVVTRNWYESLISGYLYHKSYYECSLDPFGRPIEDYSKAKYVFASDWDRRFLTYTSPESLHPPKASANQSLCDYLATVQLRDGMRTYIDVAFGRWYDQLAQNWELAHLSKIIRDRTMFACYEDLTEHHRRAATAERIVDWLFPVRDADGNNINKPKKQRLIRAFQAPEEGGRYGGGHSTSHDRTLRGELKRVIEELDRNTFNGTIAALNRQFGCGVESRATR